MADEPISYYMSRYSGEQIDELLTGLSFEIGGSYANLAAIKAAFPNGDTHAYQAADTKDIYVWNAKAKAWQSVGKLQGPIGPTGVGIESVVRTSGDGSPGTTDIYTITLSNSATSTFTVYNGADGNIADTAAAKQAAITATAAKNEAISAKNAAESSKNAAATSATNAASSAAAAESAKTAASASASSAASSAAAAQSSKVSAASSALLSQSWAEGETGARPGEDTSNAKYWANRAQAYAEQTNNPAVVQGVYNYILQDRVTGERYALLVEDGRLVLLGVSDDLDATDITIIDTQTGLAYELIAESGTLKLLEVG